MKTISPYRKFKKLRSNSRLTPDSQLPTPNSRRADISPYRKIKKNCETIPTSPIPHPPSPNYRKAVMSPRKIWVSSFLKKGYTPVDMHVHTEFSYDSFSKVDKILENARKSGFGVAITDHNEIDGAREALKKAKDVLVIPGIEVRAHSGVDILIYFYEFKELKKFYEIHVLPFKKNNPFITDLTEEEIIKRARLFKCVISAPHPFAPQRMGLAGILKSGIVDKKILNNIDLVEVRNGVMLKIHNFLARKWANKNKKKFSAGSDAHTSGEAGRILTLARLKKGEHFLDSLKREKALVSGVEGNPFLNFFVFLASEIRIIFNKRGFRMFFEDIINALTMARRERGSFFRKVFDVIRSNSTSAIFINKKFYENLNVLEKLQEKILKKLAIVDKKSKVLNLGFSRKKILKYTGEIDEKIFKKKYDLILSRVSPKNILKFEKKVLSFLKSLEKNGKIILANPERASKNFTKKIARIEKKCKKIGANLKIKKISLDEISASFFCLIISKK